jgi:transposase InsO family protein
MIQAFKYLQNELCVSVNGINNAVPGTLNMVWKQLSLNRSGKIKAWKHFADPADKRVKWIIVGSLTEIYKARLEWFYGSDLHLIAKRDNLRAAARERMDEQDFVWFLEARNESNMALYSLEDAEQLQEACGWLHLCNDPKAMVVLGWSKKLQWFDDMATVLSGLNLKGLTVSNGAVLKRRADAWNADGRRTLVHGNVDNEAARKTTDVGIERIKMIYSSPTKPDAIDVARIYNSELHLHGGAPITVERVRQLLNDDRHGWYALRHGNVEADRALSPHLKRKRASRPDALWYLDGTALQLLYMDDAGKTRSDLYIQYVTDAHTDAVVGFALGQTETSELVLSSLRNAVRNGGANTLPDQVIYDNGSANTSGAVKKALDLLCRNHHSTAAYNAKAKRVESVTGRIESQVMRHFGNYKGGNITARSIETRANAEHIKALVKDGGLPNMAGVIKQAEMVIGLWNAEQNKLQTYQTVALSERRVAQKATVIAALWQDRPDTVTYMAHGLKVQINGIRYEYAVHTVPGIEDMEWRKHYLGDTFRLRCDPDDENHTEMALFDLRTGIMVAVAQRKYEFAEAMIDRPDGEMSLLKQTLNHRKNGLKQDRTNQEASNASLRELDFPVFDHRLLHKDTLNRLESEYVNRELGVSENLPKATPQKRWLYDDAASLKELD